MLMLSLTLLTEPEEWFIDLKEPNNRYTLVLNSTKREAKWYVKYSGHPVPTLVWHDVHGNEISWSTTEDKSRKFEATLEKRSTTLKIRNPKITDSGNYVLKANNGKKQKEQQFQLLVREKPEASLTGITVKPGENATLHCEVFGFPTSTVVWYFIPCERLEFDKGSCDESKMIKYTVSVIYNYLHVH